MTLLSERPKVGKLVVPYMVDATRSPIDFKAVDPAHVDECATRNRCGICGGRIRHGPVAFIGPGDGRTCFADPWMHPECAEVAAKQCPFIAGRRDWRAGADALTQPYSDGMVTVLAWNWRAHRDPLGAWHFEAVGRPEPR